MKNYRRYFQFNYSNKSIALQNINLQGMFCAKLALFSFNDFKSFLCYTKAKIFIKTIMLKKTFLIKKKSLYYNDFRKKIKNKLIKEKKFSNKNITFNIISKKIKLKITKHVEEKSFYFTSIYVRLPYI